MYDTSAVYSSLKFTEFPEMKLTPTNVTAAFILLGISVALASPTPQGQPDSTVPARPSICLKICYSQSPQCTSGWHAGQLNNCWTCCRDIHPDGELASAGATVGAGAATGGAIGAGATTDGGTDVGVTTAGATDIGVTTAGATDTGATTNTGTGTGAST